MSTSFDRLGHGGSSFYPSRSCWDDDLVERTAIALYRYRRPNQSRTVHLFDLGSWTVDRFFEWAEEFLDAAMPDGPYYRTDLAAAGMVCHRLKNYPPTKYFGIETVRWPAVGWWYERVADGLLKELLG